MAPVPGATTRADLAYQGSPIFIPASIARLPPVGRVCFILIAMMAVVDSLLPDGGVGGFVALTCLGESANRAHGRLHPSLIHSSPAPAPVLIQAEWVQRNLPATTIAVVGRSV
jgi:hypothetical protein